MLPELQRRAHEAGYAGSKSALCELIGRLRPGLELLSLRMGQLDRIQAHPGVGNGTSAVGAHHETCRELRSESYGLGPQTTPNPKVELASEACCPSQRESMHPASSPLLHRPSSTALMSRPSRIVSNSPSTRRGSF